MSRRQFTAEEIIQALRDSAGIQAAAARRLGCTRETVARYVKRYPTVRAALEEARETTIDLAESKLIEAVREGQWPAIAFMLKTVGRHRGYVERREVVTWQRELADLFQAGRVTREEIYQELGDELAHEFFKSVSTGSD